MSSLPDSRTAAQSPAGIDYAAVAARARTRRRVLNGLQTLALVLLLAVILAPMVYMIIVSFKTRAEVVNRAASFLPAVWHFENYAAMWDYIDFGPLFANSLIVGIVTTAITTFIAALAGYSLARFRFPGADLYGISVLGTQLIPGTLFFIPLYLTFIWIKRNLGVPLTGSNLGAIILYIGFFTPISTWILRGFFASIPADLEKQAMVDGASRFTAFLRISLPLALPGIASTAIYVFMTAWDELFFSYTLGVHTVPVGIRQFVQGAAGTQLHYEYMAAASVVITIPITILFFALQRYFISGLTAGAVK